MGFEGGYRLTPLRWGEWLYEPLPGDPLRFTDSSGRTFVLGEPFETDLATIPRVFWAIPGLSKYDWCEAALIHDYLFEARYTGVLKANFMDANWVMREAVRDLGWPRAVAWIVYWLVTLFGWWFWLKGERSAKYN